MKFALINGDRAEATKGAKGVCPSCGSELVAKCGEVKVHHWGHKGSRNCDPWWENETEWHRCWKNNFPKEWQEVTHTDEESGEKHIADVKTESGWVLEFQHSYLDPQERRARIAFYPKLVWVVDGLRRKRDKFQLRQALKESISENGEPYICRVQYLDDCGLLKEWHNHRSPVLFDFQDDEDLDPSDIWLLIPEISNGKAYLTPLSRDQFIESHNNNKFDELFQNIISLIHKVLTKKKEVEHAKIIHSHPNALSGLNWIRFGRLGRRRRL